MNLREIYIYTNRISKMEGLDTLVNVETLWLNDNKIRWVQRAACVIAVFFCNGPPFSVCRHIEGLSKLARLTHVNVGCNLIERIDQAFDWWVQLA